jgi:hypothetical protein
VGKDVLSWLCWGCYRDATRSDIRIPILSRQKFFALLIALHTLSGCYFVGQSTRYAGPPERPKEVLDYYDQGSSYSSFVSETIANKPEYEIQRFTIQSHLTPITVDFYKRAQKSDRLILVFPVLGGKNIIAEYFARYYARNGFDTAIVHRNNSFKDPANFDRLEEIFRSDVIRDRIVLDFFEREIGKKEFGSFGISRGGINVGITAGVDKRLKHNVIVLGGTDIVKLFKHSSQGRLQKYTNAVLSNKNITQDEFFELLQQRIRTDPKNVSQYMDARDTLMILGLFDTTVPFKYGQQLRAQIGNPRTVYLFSDHFVGLLYTQFLHFLVPTIENAVLPMDYVEGEALDFYTRAFKINRCGCKSIPLQLLQMPFNLIGRLFGEIFVSDQPAQGEVH